MKRKIISEKLFHNLKGLILNNKQEKSNDSHVSKISENNDSNPETDSLDQLVVSD